MTKGEKRVEPAVTVELGQHITATETPCLNHYAEILDGFEELCDASLETGNVITFG